jgi:predicted nucleic-acid-binding protein
LTQDDAVQFKRALELFRDNQIWIAKTVLLETNWVLCEHYAYKSEQVITAFEKLSGLANVTLEDSNAVRMALTLMRFGIDFADGIHAASCGPAGEFITFDHRLARRAAKAGVTTIIKA